MTPLKRLNDDAFEATMETWPLSFPVPCLCLIFSRIFLAPSRHRYQIAKNYSEVAENHDPGILGNHDIFI
jgi:hypothetical protein